MPELDFRLFDADQHYYEATDAFTRHVERRMQRRAMQWAEVNGKQRLVVAGRINRFIPNPTFDPVARPGILDEYFRGRNPEGKDMASLFGELEPISPAYRDRDARLALLDDQGVEGCFLFPTLGVGMEEALAHDPEAAAAAFAGFNRWLHDDWGFAYRERIFAAPYFTLLEPDTAVRELEWALERDARVICLRAAPVRHPARSRSLGDPLHDRFWALANESGVLVAFHSGDAGYHKFAADWGESEELEAFRYAPLKMCLSASPVRDAMAALVCHGVFDRHPNLRVATIESGSGWVAPLLASFRKAYGQMRGGFRRDPSESFREHVWVAPFYEDDLAKLRGLIGAERMLMGSDFPHAEGLAEPARFAEDLKGFSDEDARRVMRENALALSRRRPATSAAA